MASFLLVRPGMLTTVQDLGRWGYQNLGVPVAGPMDWYSHRLANRLVGNADTAAALEVTLVGPELEATDAVTCAVTGAKFDLLVDGSPVPLNAPFEVRRRGRLQFGNRLAGARAVLAVRGGMDVAATFGSCAMSVIGRMGPFDGRPLIAGDVLRVGARRDAAQSPGNPLPLPIGGSRLRVVLGPHDDLFTPEAKQTLLEARYTVTSQSNRMGYRLEGEQLRHETVADILSDATPVGSLQVPASGQPILLMADRQTTGGYAKIATVISADLPVAGQLAPGDWIEFSAVSRSAAIDALRTRFHRLARHSA